MNLRRPSAMLLLALAACGNQVQVADRTSAGGGGGGGSGGSAPAGDAGSDRPSCAGRDLMCAGQSCCASQLVPGGTYNRLNDPAYPATVSDFQLDVFEVTVGRFRAFLAAFETWRAPVGSGAVPSVPGSGWDPAWTEGTETTTEDIVYWFHKKPPLFLQGYETWTDAPGPNEAMPIAFVTWEVAQEFCIWDGGRLPTEAEWNYAASGGNEQRTWAWGEEPPTPERATFAWHGHNPIDDDSKLDFYKDVGSAPAGIGRWGHLDLNGSRQEFVFDAVLSDGLGASSPPPVPCVNCALLPGQHGTEWRAPRDWSVFADQMPVPPDPPPNQTRENIIPSHGGDVSIGFRCVRGGAVVEKH